MTIGKKIIAGYALLLLLLALVGGLGLYSLYRARHAYDRFLDVNGQLLEGAHDLRFGIRDQIAHYRAILLYPELHKQYWDALQADHRQFADTVKRLQGLVFTEQGRDMVNEIAALQARHERAQEQVVALAQRGKQAEALALGAREVSPLSTALVERIDRFRDRQLKFIADGRAELGRSANFLVTTMIAAALAALILGTGAGSYLSRTLTRQLRDGIARLSSSAAEILATTSQIASGAAQTATAVSETTTTVEEVKQTAEVSSQKARYVSESAQRSAQVSQAGRKSVEQTVAAMNRIREQMESIAQSIVRLSEQGQAIGEIIATVNDLADQSNLLAVNAAIEAAKAGEHGKGFAVVAQEIRSLAEQSKQATAQVRSILTDIQKATSAAVLATEQGTKAVDAGVRQSAEAGESIRALAESIGESAQAATQIAASSQQQLVGMDQVASAMESIRQASAQNVAGTKQAESAAQNLHELGQKLKQLVGRDSGDSRRAA